MQEKSTLLIMEPGITYPSLIFQQLHLTKAHLVTLMNADSEKQKQKTTFHYLEAPSGLFKSTFTLI